MIVSVREHIRLVRQRGRRAPTPRGWVLTLGDVLRRVQIDGFTDSMHTDLYNQDLSQRRADAVKASLMARGDLTNSRRDVSSDANTRVAGLALGQRRDPPR